MKKSLIWLVTLMLVATFSLVGCKAAVEPVVEEAPAAVEEEEVVEEVVEEVAEAYDPAEKVIYYVSFHLGHPSIRTALLGVLIKGEELGYDIKVAGPFGNDHSATIAALEQIIAQKPDGIITWVNNPDYFPVIEKAYEAGIPVGNIHTWSFIDANEPKGFTYNTGGNQFGMGVDMADILAEKIGFEGVIGTTVGTFVNPNHQIIRDALAKHIEDNYPDIEVLDAIETGEEGATAESISKVVAYILANPEMEAAMGLTGNSNEIWAAAFDQIERDDIYFLGMDYTLVNLDLIKAHKTYGVMAQPLYEEGMNGVVLMDKVLRGEEVPFSNELPITLVSWDDLDAVDQWYEIVAAAEEKVISHLGLQYFKRD